MAAGETIASSTITDLATMARHAEEEASQTANALKRAFVASSTDNDNKASKVRVIAEDIPIDDADGSEGFSERAVPKAVFGALQ